MRYVSKDLSTFPVTQPAPRDYQVGASLLDLHGILRKEWLGTVRNKMKRKK